MIYYSFYIITYLVDSYQTKFYNSRPTDFNESKYSKPYVTTYHNIKYFCYPHKLAIQNITDVTPQEYLKTKLDGVCYEFTHTQYWYFKFCPFHKLYQYRYNIDNITRLDNFQLGHETSSNKYTISQKGITTIWENGDMC